MQLEFSIIIPVLNEEGRISTCLDNLSGLDFNKENYEIILVDNGCEDKTVDIAKRYDVKIVKEHRKGITFARQKGLESASGKYYITTDADAIVPKDWLKNAQKTFNSDPKIDFISGPTKSYDVSTFLFGKIFYYSSMVLPTIFHHPIGCNMAFKRKVLIEVGGFLYNNYKFYEDGIIAVKLHKSGYKFKFDKKFVNYISSRRYKGLRMFNAFKNLGNYISLKYRGKLLSDTLKDLR